MATKTRTYDPARVRAALAGQIEALRSTVRGLDEAQLSLPTRLGDWRVRELVSHLGMVVSWVPAHLDDPIPDVRPITPLYWARQTRTAAATINDIAEELAAGAFAGPAAAVAAEFDRCCDALLAALPAAEEPGRLIAMRFGPMPLADFLVTRLVETVVHADDLAQALGTDFAHEKQAVAAATRLLADAFADQVPGGAVELRVPPYAVVQAVEGPKHTRGTPPNVVEAEPLTWIRLATGRVAWAEVLDVSLSASGERSDLSTLLPVLG
ncbi:maleylpyruvate isomerase family mycothiol-dependent enzyme [Kitasatospora terrestris]|uniref:Maleylpyruvate isomerase family mycothiol-dependent enzyme n=1 Tax=Kitasatospora terrestris TaxID=258051 RepID=A0ABP9DT43_9ACTN